METVLAMALAFPLSDYTTIAIGVHPTLDAPEVLLGNPLFMYEAGIHLSNDLTVFYNHVSGITTAEEGGGLNMFGLKYKLK